MSGDAEHTAEKDAYPRLVNGRWVMSLLHHLAVYAERADETYVAVPVKLLRDASRWRECGARKTFTHDEDGPIAPFDAACRRQEGHDATLHSDHVRTHSNGYFTWTTPRVAPPGSGDQA